MRLNRLLPIFVLPTGVSIILLALGIWRRRRGLQIAGLLLLFVASLPAVGGTLAVVADGGRVRRPLDAIPRADAIVVLSAGRTIAPGPARVSEWGEANRFDGGIELFRAGKAPRLVFTAARVSTDERDPTEGATLAAYARVAGVPNDAIIVTGTVENTEDEAREVALALAGRGSRPRVILVTSAVHMTRAERLFRAAGLDVDPFPVRFARPVDYRSLLTWIPQAGGLYQTDWTLREFYGRAYYRLR